MNFNLYSTSFSTFFCNVGNGPSLSSLVYCFPIRRARDDIFTVGSDSTSASPIQEMLSSELAVATASIADEDAETASPIATISAHIPS